MHSNKVVKNASWIIISKVCQSVLGFVVSILTARYLGPSNYGIINYAASLTAFALPIMQLGFNGVIVQELTNAPEEEGKIMGSTILLSLLSSMVCILGVFCFCSISAPDDEVTIKVCVLYSLVLIFQALDLIQYWYQAKLLSKYTSIVSVLAYIVFSAYKIFLLVTGKSIYWFAISTSLDYFIISVSLVVVYKKLGGKPLRFSWITAKRIIKTSKYYIVSGLMVTVFAQTDRIMLKLMVGEEATGLYSAAVSCAGLTSFIFSAIIDSLRPVILQNYKDNDCSRYENSVVQLYSIVIYLAFFQSIFVAIFSSPIIGIMYGSNYSGSVVALRIVVWYTMFTYFGGAKDVWMLAERKQKYLVWLNLSGAVANIILNFFLIPISGIAGAAIASLITQLFTNIIMMAIIKPLRNNCKLLGKALNPNVIISIGKQLLTK